jgi:hypothetical protein
MKYLKYLVNIILLLVLILSSVPDKTEATQVSDRFVVGVNSYASGDEIVERRTENSKTTYLGGNKFALDVSMGAIHYKDNYTSDTEQWKDIDLTPVNGVVMKAPYTLVVDGAKVTMTDKKTGSVTVLELTDTGNKKLVKPLLATTKGKAEKKNIDTDTDLEITWENTRVKVTRVLKSDKAPKSAKFNLSQTGTGIKIDYQAQDASTDKSKKIKIDTSLVGGVLTESVDTSGLTYPVRVDPILNISVAAGTDDADVYLGLAGIHLNAPEIIFGATNQSYRAGMRFTVSIPVDSTIYSSYIAFTGSWDMSSDTVRVLINAQQSNIAATFSTYADFVSRGQTTASVPWNFTTDWAVDGVYNTPDISTILQELVGDYGGLFGNTIVLFINDNGSDTGANRHAWSYDGSVARCPKLHIEYTNNWGVITLPATSPSYVGGHCCRLNGEMTGTGQTFRGFGYGTTSNTTMLGNEDPYAVATYTSLSPENLPFVVPFLHNVCGLAAGTKYYFRAFVFSAGTYIWGSELSFTTLSMPIITTLAATNISSGTARLNSLINNDSGAGASVRFLRGTATGTYTTNSTWVAGYVAGNNPYLDITGLASGTTYHVRAEIKSSVSDALTSMGAEEDFTTFTTTGTPTDLSAIPSSTTVSLLWNKGVGSDSTEIRYNVGTYPISTLTGTLGYSGTGVSTEITGLTPGTSYYFMAWGVTSGAYSTSNATVMATTLAGSTTPPVMPTPATPDNWFQAPDYTNMANTPFYSIVNFAADAFAVPKGTLWYMCALFFCVAIGVFFYSTVGNANLFLSICAVGAMMLACSLMKLVPYWHILPFAVFAAVGIFVGERR